MKVMIVVTHLLGTGHLSRAATLARGILAAGHEVTLVSGGMPAPHLSLDGVPVIQLPPLRSDGVQFTRLLDKTGAPAMPDLLQARLAALLESFAAFAPDALVTELFPFGRRMLREEFTALLEEAQAQDVSIVASVRDVLNPPSKPEKAVWADEMIARYYDAVLVHADPEIIRLEASWPVSEALRAKLHYTGFVAPSAPVPPPGDEGRNEVLVSAGGGAVGHDLFRAARAAAEQDAARNWRILVGGTDAIALAAELAQGAPDNLTVEPVRPDYRHLLSRAAASVSFCGYNTALDVLQTGVRAVFVPFDAGGEAEQSIRAQALAGLSGVTVLPSDALSPDSLRAAIDEVCAAPRPTPRLSGLDGATLSADILTALVQRTR